MNSQATRKDAQKPSGDQSQARAQNRAQTAEPVRHVPLIILGLACNQAFVYSTFYLIASPANEAAALPVSHTGLLLVLAWMIVAFIAVYVLDKRSNRVLFSKPLLVVYAILSIIGTTGYFVLGASLPLFVVQGICLGFPAAVMLCAWGRVMGTEPIERSIPEVFIASALGGAICFVFAAVPSNVTSSVTFVLMIGSILCHCVASRYLEAPILPEDTMSKDATRLSGRIVAGTCVYGLAAGLVEMLAASTTATAPSITLLLLLFVLYCLAALQLFGGRPTSGRRSVLPDQEGSSSNKDDGPLGGSYRLAVFLMMAGLLLVPILSRFSLPEESVIMAGYLGVSVVLIALFLVMSCLAGHNGVLSFARGFAALFLGEAAGILVGNIFVLLPFENAEFFVVPIAGIAVLCGYFFLFTERDLHALSVVVEDTNLFDEACETIAQEAELSKRETEILPLALRGRTSERIAEKLFITKNTVDTHLRRIYAKCDVHSRQELIDLGEHVENELRSGR